MINHMIRTLILIRIVKFYDFCLKNIAIVTEHTLTMSIQLKKINFIYLSYLYILSIHIHIDIIYLYITYTYYPYILFINNILKYMLINK